MSQPSKLRVAADVAAFAIKEGKLNVLLVRRGQAQAETELGSWALPGAFLGENEDLSQCARRAVEGEAGVQINALRQFGSYSDPDRDPRQRVVSVAFVALIEPSHAKAGQHVTEASWFPLKHIPRPLAFDHDEILSGAVHALQGEVRHSDIAFGLLEDSFTLAELQAVHEVVLGQPLDKRNFRRSLMQSGTIEETGSFRKDGGRPAQLFRAVPGERSTLFGSQRHH